MNRELTITRTLNASIENVWEAWTNPESMKQWFSPEGMTNPQVDVNLAVGGTYRVVMEGRNMPDPKHNGTMPVGGKYLEIKKPNKLVFTWLWEGAPAETHTTTVTVLLQKVGESKTKLTLIHTGFADDTMQQEHNKGWTSTINKLYMILNH